MLRFENLAMAEKTSRELGLAEHERIGKRDVGRQFVTWQRGVEAVGDDRFEARLAVFADRHLRPELRADGLQLVVDVSVGRVQLRGNLQLDQRLFELAGGGRAGARW